MENSLFKATPTYLKWLGAKSGRGNQNDSKRIFDIVMENLSMWNQMTKKILNRNLRLRGDY